MYQVNNNTKYYVYDCRKQAYLYVSDSIDELIEWVAQWNYYSIFSDKKKNNRILDEFNCTMKDTKVHLDWVGNGWTDLREYVVFDSDYRIIDIRMYEKEILNYVIPAKRKKKWKNKALEYKYEKTKPEFRKGPVPMTGGHRGYCYRHPKTFNEMKQNCDVETRQYVRKSRLHLPTAYDDIYRDTPRCWKDQSKKRKQWM